MPQTTQQTKDTFTYTGNSNGYANCNGNSRLLYTCLYTTAKMVASSTQLQKFPSKYENSVEGARQGFLAPKFPSPPSMQCHSVQSCTGKMVTVARGF